MSEKYVGTSINTIIIYKGILIMQILYAAGHTYLINADYILLSIRLPNSKCLSNDLNHTKKTTYSFKNVLGQSYDDSFLCRRRVASPARIFPAARWRKSWKTGQKIYGAMSLEKQSRIFFRPIFFLTTHLTI